MPEAFSRTRPCVNCRANTRMVLHRRLMVSGGFHYCWLCSRCSRLHRQNGHTWIPHALVMEWLSTEQLESLPILAADRVFFCVKCGAGNTELHHWAPKAVFGPDEAEQWPVDYLCPSCHQRWHAKMKGLPDAAPAEIS